MFSNALKKVMLFGLIFTLVWSLNAAALAADATATIGSTGAEAQFSKETNDDGTFTVKSDSAETQAYALSNPQGETEGRVDAKLPPEENSASSTSPKEIDSGESSTVSVDTSNTTAKTEDIIISPENTEEQSVEATEDVKNIQVKATGDVNINDEELDTILSAKHSKGTSVIEERWLKDENGELVKDENENPYGHIVAETEHKITEVCIFAVENKCIIKFKSGSATATTKKLVNVDNAYESTATAKIEGLKIWDPSISNYVEFGDFENSSDSVKDFTETLKAMNKILGLSNIEITIFLYVLASTGDNMSSAEAKLIQAILKDASNNPLITVDIADVRSKIVDFKAETSGEEIKINDATTTPTTTTTQTTPQPVATTQQPIVEAVAAAETPDVVDTVTKSSTPTTTSTSSSTFPRTGLPEQNTESLLLLLGSLMLLASMLLRKRKKVTQ